MGAQAVLLGCCLSKTSQRAAPPLPPHPAPATGHGGIAVAGQVEHHLQRRLCRVRLLGGCTRPQHAPKGLPSCAQPHAVDCHPCPPSCPLAAPALARQAAPARRTWRGSMGGWWGSGMGTPALGRWCCQGHAAPAVAGGGSSAAQAGATSRPLNQALHHLPQAAAAGSSPCLPAAPDLLPRALHQTLPQRHDVAHALRAGDDPRALLPPRLCVHEQREGVVDKVLQGGGRAARVKSVEAQPKRRRQLLLCVHRLPPGQRAPRCCAPTCRLHASGGLMSTARPFHSAGCPGGSGVRPRCDTRPPMQLPSPHRSLGGSLLQAGVRAQPAGGSAGSWGGHLRPFSSPACQTAQTAQGCPPRLPLMAGEQACGRSQEGHVCEDQELGVLGGVVGAPIGQVEAVGGVALRRHRATCPSARNRGSAMLQARQGGRGAVAWCRHAPMPANALPACRT